jgi:exodeoxyribonuclease III
VIEQAGYGAVWRGQKSWNGVAILARDREPIVTSTEAVGVLITPNGNPQIRVKACLDGGDW